MGQKVSPIGFRLGINKDWDSTWFATSNYPALVLEDFKVRNYINGKLKRAAISNVKIKRRAKQIEIDIKCARPGMVIGRGGADSAKLKAELESLVQKKVALNIVEQENPEKCAILLAQSLAVQLERRVAFRRAMKQIVNIARGAGAQGIKVCCAGRLAGAEIARTEWYREGRVPLQTIRADIDYAFTEALTVYGKIGVKVWVYKGDIIVDKKEKAVVEEVLAEEAL